jgi:alpha-galactosidase
MIKKVFSLVTLFLVVGFIALTGCSNSPAVSANGKAVKSLAASGITKPAMGWNSWNHFGGNISESTAKGEADAMVSSGLSGVGYQYINLDDNWMKSGRDSSGNLVGNSNFPSGMKALGDYIHGKGLKFGIYGDHGTMTCMCVSQSGGYGNFSKDANTYASWGVDYLKYDNCQLPSGDNVQSDYTTMANALTATGRQIYFSLCAWVYYSWEPSLGNSWRTTGDISDNWSSMYNNFESSGNNYTASSPGHYNDPDMLEIGNGGLNQTEEQSHFAMWCISAAPLIIGCDINGIYAGSLTILKNTDAIAIDQDSLGIGGHKVTSSGGEAWMKKLSDGSIAVLLLNAGSSTASVGVSFSTLGLGSTCSIYDCESHSSLGSFSTSFTDGALASHACRLLKVTSTSGTVTPTPTPTGTKYEAESGTITGGAVKTAASWASGGYYVGYIGGGTTATNGICTITVNVSSAGTHTLTIYYAVSGTRTFYITPNSGSYFGVSCTGSSWSADASVATSITLNAGNNTIKFDNGSGAWAPDLDYILVQ